MDEKNLLRLDWFWQNLWKPSGRNVQTKLLAECLTPVLKVGLLFLSLLGTYAVSPSKIKEEYSVPLHASFWNAQVKSA